MNSMNLKFGDVTERKSPTFSDCHYVKTITFSLDYCLLSMFSIFWHITKNSLSFVNICHNFSLFMEKTMHFILRGPAHFIDASLLI